MRINQEVQREGAGVLKSLGEMGEGGGKWNYPHKLLHQISHLTLTQVVAVIGAPVGVSDSGGS